MAEILLVPGLCVWAVAACAASWLLDVDGYFHFNGFLGVTDEEKRLLALVGGLLSVLVMPFVFYVWVVVFGTVGLILEGFK